MAEHDMYLSVEKRNPGLYIILGFSIVFLFFVISGAISYLNIRTVSRAAEEVAHTHEVILALSDLMSITKDAETGQRGYIITGDERYLAPYKASVARIDSELSNIEALVADNPTQRIQVPQLRVHFNAKFAELQETIELRGQKSFETARNVVVTDRGKAEMDALRALIGNMQAEEKRTRAESMAAMVKAQQTAIWSGILSSISGITVSIAVAYLLWRAYLARRKENWLQAGQVGLNAAMIGNLRIEELGENILIFLARYFNAQVGTFFVEEGNNYRLVSSYGLIDNHGRTEFKKGEGLIGQAIKDEKTFYINDLPEGYIKINSSLGQNDAKHLIIAPAIVDGKVNAVFELGFIHSVNRLIPELLDRMIDPIGVAVRSANYRSHLQQLLEETQRQTEELQSQSEELRVNNEELEEQSRALKESHVRLEQQQAELEQSNSQLEEQAELLEGQRNDLARAKSYIEQKAQELEQASQYKSDFLANMSHELRTPLNASLIMAKLLSDNPEGNLTEEQVKFAQTIYSSGNDLLVLINDILDLSKIEAGHMEICAEAFSPQQMMSDLERIFDPLARQKGLNLSATIASDCPARIETDRQRLEQILKNLIANAIKFTEKGEVEIHVSAHGEDKVKFAVKDTGIGIESGQQQSIFDAFRQADGTISRKYGGTGLGLSISRQLTRLLGGSIELSSKSGEGSTFTVIIPLIYDVSHVSAQLPPVKTKKFSLTQKSESQIKQETKERQDSQTLISMPAGGRIKDDRNELTGDSRIILIVEDDEPFAQILYELAHELKFQSIIATSAEEALIIAQQYVPSALVLDVGLPDHSGLSVLDRLKRDSRTRHIPVHIVSAGDYAQTALSLGAAGYMLKPVKREELAEALKQLEEKSSQRLRHVLIAEDNPAQRESMCRLLGSQAVETVGVGTAAECLEQLKARTFDCLVLDLSLPDASGYSLLETLSQEDDYSFPPVIVYTGRELSLDEEQRLRKYSKSIIIKGAKSPERLLDEVTLFLHQVVADLSQEQQKMLEKAHNRDAVLEGRNILIVEDDIRNVYALTSILEPQGVLIKIARNGREALDVLNSVMKNPAEAIDLILMDVMMPEMDGLTATREIRKKTEWRKLPIITLTAKAMKDDQERCLNAGANDYMAKPLDVEKLLSLIRVWMPR